MATTVEFTAIVLTIDGRKLTFPAAAFSDLARAHRPWPLYTDGLDARRARFQIEGGDGEKSYTVTYVVTKDRLIRRELTRPLAVTAEVTRYNTKAR